MDELAVETFAMSMWRSSEALLQAPIKHLESNVDTFVDIYNNLSDIIRLANMSKHEEIKE